MEEILIQKEEAELLYDRKVILLSKGDLCEYPDCRNEAIGIAYDRELREVNKYCEIHMDRVADTGEYTQYCPNCGCKMAIN